MFKKIKKYICDPDFRFLVNAMHGLYKKMPDAEYLKKMYKARFKKELNLDNPQTFSEKMQWLKIHDKKDFYGILVDKYKVKQYVSKIIGSEHIIPTLGVFDSFGQIDFATLPEQFVIKCTHDSGGMAICHDKKTFDIKKAKRRISKYLKRDFYYLYREWPYKAAEHKIIIEKYMENNSGEGLIDYKFYCFNGKPRFLYISKGLENHSTARISFLNLDWTFAPYERSDFKTFDKLPPKPTCFDEMVMIAKKLSQGFAFIRVDLYQIDDVVYFSELTFFPCAGYMPLKNDKHDFELGNMLDISALIR